MRLRTRASAPALSSVAELCAFVSGQLSSHADPAKAGPMAAYMKTHMPFYGVAAPERVLTFLHHNRGRLSSLSFREAARRLKRQGYPL